MDAETRHRRLSPKPVEPTPQAPDDTTQPCCYRQVDSSGNHGDRVVVAFRAAGIGLEEIVDLVSGAAGRHRSTLWMLARCTWWVERAAEPIVDP